MKGSLCALKQSVFSVLMSFSLFSQLCAGVISHDCLDRQEVFGLSTTIYHGAAVEPSIAVNPKKKNHIVACWQQDRISNGGALEVGISYSRDNGRTWHKARVPFQVCAGGVSQRVTDTWLSYSPEGNRVYLCALVINATTDVNTQNQQGVVVTYSEDDGKTWSHIAFLAASENSFNELSGEFALDDKPAVTADPNRDTHAYAVWDRFDQVTSFHSTTQISRTTDSGKTWSQRQVLYDPFPDLTSHNQSNGILNDTLTGNNIIIALPKVKKKSSLWKEDRWGNGANKQDRLSGDLINFMVRRYARPSATDAEYLSDTFPHKFTLFDIAQVRSKDQGKTWETSATVVTSFQESQVYTGGYTIVNGQIASGKGTHLRAGTALPTYAVNPKNGFLYVAWTTGQFRADKLPQVAMKTSRDGGRTWSSLARVSRTPYHAHNPQAFTPFVSVTKNGRVGVLYFDFRKDNKTGPANTKLDAWLAIYQEMKNPKGGSTGIGLDFVKEIRLSEKSFIAQNGPVTNQGNMVIGDYPFLVAQESTFYAIYTKSFKGPFTKPTTFFNDTANKAVILLDDNYRGAPFVSIVESGKSEKRKGRVRLIRTKMQKSNV